jgi:hypothetical protein
VTLESVLTCFAVSLFVAAILAMVLIVREAFPRLTEQDQTRFKDWFRSGGELRFSINGPLREVWNEHCRWFPQSRKRILFAFLLIAASLSVMSIPLWLAFGQR